MSTKVVRASNKGLSDRESTSSCIDKTSMAGMREGDVYIDDKGTYHKVLKLTFDPQEDREATEKEYEKKRGKKLDWKEHSKLPKNQRVWVDDVRVEYISNYAGVTMDDDEWSKRPETFLLVRDKNKTETWAKLTDESKYRQIASDVIAGKMPLPTEVPDGETEGPSTGLMHSGSKEHLAAMQKAANEKMQHFLLVQHMVQRELETKKNHLKSIVSHFHGMVETFKDKVRKIQKIIDTIELYLGIHETILQFQEGPKASVDEPITFRQKIMFMDEEVGDPRLDRYGNNEGLDFNNIEDFDSWLCDNENYKKVIPEQKCVCVFKVRRHIKEGHRQISDNPFILSLLQNEDKKTYILIRNGDNLYRIWTNLGISDRLFPHRTELLELQQELVKHPDPRYYEHRKAKEKLDYSVEHYQRQFIMMQGLLDRTEILHPLKQTIKLSELDLDKTDAVRFIYDDGAMLVPAGHVPFDKWVKKVNSTIEEGSRILIFRYPSSRMGRFDERYRGNWDKDYVHLLPESPSKGLHTVYVRRNEKGIKTPWSGYENRPKEAFCLYYNPGDEIINWWDSYDRGHERKNNVSFIIDKDRDDFFINFDEVTTKDIDYYLDSRIDRHEYLRMMPMLWEARQKKKEEEDEEHDFLLMVIAPFASKASQEELLKAAREDMRWWKLKNKWKRSLKKDDAKAYRMIGARLKKRFK